MDSHGASPSCSVRLANEENGFLGTNRYRAVPALSTRGQVHLVIRRLHSLISAFLCCLICAKTKGESEGLVKKSLMEDRFSCTWEGTELYTTKGQQSPGEGFENDFLTVPSEQVT